MLLQVPVCTTGSQPMRRQDRGDVGDDLSSRMQELRMDASSKGIAWLQKKVDSMGRDDLRKMAAAVALSTRGPGVRWCQWLSYARPSWSTLPRRRVCWGEGVGFGEDFVSVVNSFFG